MSIKKPGLSLAWLFTGLPTRLAELFLLADHETGLYTDSMRPFPLLSRQY